MLSLEPVSKYKKNINAITEPMCIAAIISKLRYFIEKNLSNIIRCKDELTGINSVTPWITEAINRSII